MRRKGKGKLLVLDVPRAEKVSARVEVQRFLIRDVQTANLEIAHVVGDRVRKRRACAVFDDEYAVSGNNGGRCNGHEKLLSE